MKKEPALIVSGVAALIGLLVSFGVNISEAQTNAILTFIGVIAPVVLPLLSGFVTRRFTWSADSVEKVTNQPLETNLQILESKKGMQ